MERFLRLENHDIPLLGLGTYGMKGKSGVRCMIDAIEDGYRHFDTAQMYNNEEEVGEAVRQSGVDRREFFITTKISAYNLKPDSIEQSTRRSVEKLGTDYADLLLIHWPGSGMDLQACISTMARLKDDGLTRLIGVSNFSPQLFEESMRYGPVICNQVEFSPYVPALDNLEMARRHHVMITAYSPLGKGRISRDRRLAETGKKYHKTSAQVALRWLLQLGPTTVIPKASDEVHRKENADIFDFTLSKEDMDHITAGV